MEQGQRFLTFLWHQGILTVILWLNVTSILQTWSTKKSYASFFSYTGMGMGTNGTHRSHARCHPYPIPQPVKRGWPHHWGLRPLLFSNSGVCSFTFHMNWSVKMLWDRTWGFLSLSEKTRKSNHLQISLQRQHFLLIYLKILSVGPAGVWTRDLPLRGPALYQLSFFKKNLSSEKKTRVFLKKSEFKKNLSFEKIWVF